MKNISLPRIILTLLPLVLALPDLKAQLATWVGQTPSDPQRFSSWNDPAHWSTGTVPNGAAAQAQLIEGGYYLNSLIDTDNVLLSGAAVTLDGLFYGRVRSPFDLYALNFPVLRIGGPAAGDQAVLELVGTGMSPAPSLGSQFYRSLPRIELQNGRLVFSNQTALNFHSGMQIQTLGGSNQVWFRDDSLATGLRLNLGTGSRLDVTDRARLQNSTLEFTGGEIAFSGQSSFTNSSARMSGPGLINFSGQSTVTSGFFTFLGPAGSTDSILRFSGNTQVRSGSANSSFASGAVEFTDQANADGFNLNFVRLLDVTGASTGTGTTGRQRATTGTPGATSVVADDARTLVLGVVSVEDLMLGSNTVVVRGGNLRHISDTGGAYLSASGANLTGGGIIMAASFFNSLFLASTNAPAPYAVPLTVEFGTVITDRQQLGAVAINPSGAVTLRAGASKSIMNQGLVTLTSTNYLVNGNYTQTASGRLSLTVPVNGIGVPLLNISGEASLAGSLTVGASGSFVGSRRYPILRAGSISGRFTTATELTVSPMLSMGVEYSGNEIYFAFTQRPFVNAGATRAQQALGGHLDATLAGAAGDYFNLLLRLNTLQDPALVAAGLGQLAPDRYTVLNEQGFSTAAGHQAALDRQMAHLRRNPSAEGFAAWVEGGQQQNRFASLDGLPLVRFRSDRGLAGVTWRRDRWSGGLSVAKDRSTADLDGIGSRARISAQAPGGFVQYDAPRFFVNAAASLSRDDYNLVRNSGLIGRPSVVSAAPSGRRTDLSATIGTSLQRKSWTLTPYAGVLASHVRLDDFTESRVSGSAGSELAFSRWSVGSLRTRAGLDLSCATRNGRLVPRLSVVWLHELEDERGLSAGLAATGAARYRAPGRPAETDLVQASFGVDWRLTRQLGFSLNAGLAEGRNSATSSDLSVGFRWEF